MQRTKQIYYHFKHWHFTQNYNSTRKNKKLSSTKKEEIWISFENETKQVDNFPSNRIRTWG